MNNDILPPKRPLGTTQSRPASSSAIDKATTESDASLPSTVGTPEQSGLSTKPRRRSIWKWLLGTIGVVLFLAACAVGASFLWYNNQLAPVDASDQSRVRVTVESGTSPDQIAGLLEQKGVIRSSFAFTVYTRLHDVQNQLQAGVFSLSPSETLPEIVEHLVSGKTDQFSITFYPGATLTDTTDTEDAKKVDVTNMLLRAGYSEEEISVALKKTYDHPLFQDKPTTADLEGYVYGETYTFGSGASVEDILTTTFDEYYSQIEKNNLIEGFKAQGLNLYQGITLASIIQREVPKADDQKQVAQIFLKRYREGMQLGSDITAYYGADKLGVRRTVAVDSPYNTRMYTGLPPGPIAVPGVTALQAVAAPASGDYVYFLSGDDEVTYYARTSAEHEQNILNHCTIKCAME